MGVFSLTFLDPFVCCCFSVSLPFLRCYFFPSSCFFLSTCSSSDEFHWYTARDHHRFILILSFHFSSLLMPTFMGRSFFSSFFLLLEILSLLLPHSIGAFLLHKLTHTYIQIYSEHLYELEWNGNNFQMTITVQLSRMYHNEWLKIETRMKSDDFEFSFLDEIKYRIFFSVCKSYGTLRSIELAYAYANKWHS